MVTATESMAFVCCLKDPDGPDLNYTRNGDSRPLLKYILEGVVGTASARVFGVRAYGSEMPSDSLGEELVRRGAAKAVRRDACRTRWLQLFEEAREDVYRYLLTLGLYPPQAQEAAQEVFLRLYTTLRKGRRNPVITGRGSFAWPIT